MSRQLKLYVLHFRRFIYVYDRRYHTTRVNRMYVAYDFACCLSTQYPINFPMQLDIVFHFLKLNEPNKLKITDSPRTNQSC